MTASSPRTGSTSATRAWHATWRRSPAPSAVPARPLARCPSEPRARSSGTGPVAEAVEVAYDEAALAGVEQPGGPGLAEDTAGQPQVDPGRAGPPSLGPRDLDRLPRPLVAAVELGEGDQTAIDADGARDVGQLGHLAGQPVDHGDEDADQQPIDLGVLLTQLLELAPADHQRLGRLDGLDRRAAHGGPVEQGLLTEEVAWAHEGDRERVAVGPADEHGHAALDDEVEGIAGVALVHEVGATAVLAPPAPRHQRGARVRGERSQERRVRRHSRRTLPTAHECASEVRIAS